MQWSTEATSVAGVSGVFSSGGNLAKYRDGGTASSGVSSIGVIKYNNGGAGEAHNNMQPSIGLSYIIKV